MEKIFPYGNETTPTPQGDGNKAWYTGFPVSLETTYTPQGDGNVRVIMGFLAIVLKYITPRKGTITV